MVEQRIGHVNTSGGGLLSQYTQYIENSKIKFSEPYVLFTSDRRRIVLRGIYTVTMPRADGIHKQDLYDGSWRVEGYSPYELNQYDHLAVHELGGKVNFFRITAHPSIDESRGKIDVKPISEREWREDARRHSLDRIKAENRTLRIIQPLLPNRDE